MLVLVPMMQVRDVRMRMTHWRVFVRMGMRLTYWPLVLVLVMLVVRVHMLVLDCVVQVFVVVPGAKKHDDANDHEHFAHQMRPAQGLAQQGNG